MTIQGNEKLKVQKTVNDVSAGRFDERDVDYLFMSLRAHSGTNRIFREISDFVAHNDIRDKGVTTLSLEAFYLSIKYFSEYITTKISLDIGGPFPAYIIKLMKFQIDKCNEEVLREKFRVTKTRLKSRLDNLFKIDKRNQTASLIKKLSEPNYLAVKYILGFIGSHPAYTQQEIISELVTVLFNNNLVFEKVDFLKQSDRIMLCVLALIHNTEYDFKGHKKGRCNISCEKHDIPYNDIINLKDGDITDVSFSFGNLQINGIVQTINNGREVLVAYPVITTNLDVEKWSDETLFTIYDSGEGIRFKNINFEGPIGVSSGFKLVSSSA